MEYKTIRGLKIPALGIGTWGMGGKFEPDTTKKNELISVLKEAIRLGITHIDTAEVYGHGFTEELVGEAIQGFTRNDLFITSKLWNTHLTRDDAMTALQQTLRRLRTDYLDLYLIHRPSLGMNLEGTMGALEHLFEQRLIRGIGVSNFTRNQMLEAQRYLKKTNIVAVQDEFNLLTRNTDSLDYCKDNDALFIAYRPLASGKLAKPGIRLLDDLSQKYEKSQAQIALNWILNKPNTVTIPKSASIDHVKENLGALGWTMDRADYAALDTMGFTRATQ